MDLNLKPTSVVFYPDFVDKPLSVISDHRYVVFVLGIYHTDLLDLHEKCAALCLRLSDDVLRYCYRLYDDLKK